MKPHYLGSLLLVTVLTLHSLYPALASAPTAPHYLDTALLKGRYVSRWNDSTQVIKVNLEYAPKIPGWSPKKMELVKSAFTEWEQVLGGRLRFVYTNSPYETDLLVKWRQQSMGEVIGLTSVQWDSSQTLTDTDIVIALMSPNGKYQTDSELRSTALHEIGHALGIKGHSNNPKDIMYPSINRDITRLSQRDINTMKALYARKADITNPVGITFAQYQRFLYYARLGSQALKSNQAALAYKHLTMANKYYPKHPKMPFLVGLSAYNADQFDDAIKHLQKAVQTKGPEQPVAQFYLAESLVQSGQIDLDAGRENTGQSKWRLAKQYYQGYLKASTQDPGMKQAANNNLAQINSLLKGI